MSDQDRGMTAAEDCERLARRTANLEDRNTLLNMARLWRELAQSSVTADWIETQPPTPRPRTYS